MRWAGALLVAVALVSGGCTDARAPQPVPEFAVAWREATLPRPAGGPGAPMIRDAAVCGGTWFLAGAVRDPSGGTRPAVWSSTDAATWHPVRMQPVTFYGAQNVLSTLACRTGGLVTVGAKTGGMHGNPRTSSWRSVPGGAVREVAGDFQLYGGPDAVNVGRVAAGPAGFLIAGNRVSGAAVWSSPDGGDFRLRADAPGLPSDSAGATWADDAAAVPDGWLVVGGVRPPGRTDRDALGWRSADGASWTRLPADGSSPAFEEIQRVVVRDRVPVGLGVSGSTFGAWRLDGARWRPVGSFGAIRTTGAAGVASAAVAGARLFCLTNDGTAYAMWMSPDGGATWRPVALPAPMAAGHDGGVAVAAEANRLVLSTDDGATARVYAAPIPE